MGVGATRGPDADSRHHDFGVVGLVMGSTQVRLSLTPLVGPWLRGGADVVVEGSWVGVGRTGHLGLSGHPVRGT